MTPWLAVASGYVGLAEIPGRDTAPVIARWLRDLRAWWSDDETPWCGTFVAACLTEAGLRESLPKHWYRAKAWLEAGYPLVRPSPGAIAVFDRKGGGHVGFIVGRDPGGRLLILGGNQGNRVSIAPFDPSRLLGFRWPVPPSPGLPEMPTLYSTDPSSIQEA